MANGRFLLWLKNVLKINTIPGYSADYDKTRGDSVFIDNSNRVMEVNNLQEGLTATEYHGKKASLLDGSSQYWSRALPTDIASFNPATISGGNPPTGWVKEGSCTITYETTEAGSVGCMKILFGSNTGFKKTGILTIGKKYKVSFRYKANYFFRIGSLTAAYRQPSATAEWNNITFVFTADSTDFYIRGEGAYYAWIESLTIKEDQRLDLNRDQEMILHSKNAGYERTLLLNYSNDGTNATGWGASGTGASVTSSGGKLIYTRASSGTSSLSRTLTGISANSLILVKLKARVTSGAATIKISNSVDIGAIINNITISLTNTETTYSGTYLAKNSTIYFDYVVSGASEVIEFDDIEVYEIPNLFTNGAFVDGTHWLREEPATQTFADGVCHFVNTTLNYSIYADSANRKLIYGRRYRLSLQILNLVSGGLKTGGTGVPISPGFTSNGVHTFDFTYSGSNGSLYLSASAAGTTLDLDNLHIYEIPEWSPSFAPVSGNNHYCDITTLDKASGTQSQRIVASGAGRGSELLTNPTISGSSAGWTITVPAVVAYGNDNLVCTNLNNSSTLKPTGVTVTAGKIYEVIFTITVTSGNIAFVSGVGATGRTNKTVSGTYREVQTCVNTGDFYIDGTNFYGTIESLYVKEIFGEITLPAANIETLVAGKKYTFEGKARLDPASLIYGTDLFSSIQHSATYPYETFTASGNDITSAINTTGFASAFISIGNVIAGQIVKVTFNLTLNSGAAPRVLLMQSGEAIEGTNSGQQIPVAGANTLYFTVTATQSPTYLVIREPATTATNFSIADIVVVKANPVSITHQIGTKSLNSGALSIVPGSFTKYVLNFEATTAEVNADWKSYLDGQGSVFVDELSLTQLFDTIRCYKYKITNAQAIGEATVLMNGGIGAVDAGGTWTYYNLATNNIVVAAQSQDYRLASSLSSGVTARNTFINEIDYWDRTTAFRIYHDGVLKASAGWTTFGKILNKHSDYYLKIGSWTSAGGVKFAGQIRVIQIIRFDNISKTDFNPNTYQPGDAITDNGGGVPEVVLGQDWENITGAIANDKYRPETTVRNDLTAYGSPLASTEVVTVKDYSPQTKKLAQGTRTKQPIYSSTDGFDFDGTDDILEAPQTLGSVKTVILKLKADNLEYGQDILQLNGSAKLTLGTDGVITATGWISPTITIQDTLLQVAATIAANTEYLIAVRTSTAIDATAFKLGGSTSFYNGKIKKVAVFNTTLDDPTIQKIFKSIRSI